MSDEDFSRRINRRLTALLMPDEPVLAAGQRHWLSYAKAFILMTLAAIVTGLALVAPQNPNGEAGSARLLLTYAAAGLWGFTLLNYILTAIRNWTMVMVVTPRRVFLRTGFIARDIVDIPLAKVDVVNLEQGIWGRIFGCGDVLVRTVGEVTITFPAISNPTTMRNAIVAAMESLAQRNSGPAKQG